MKIVNTDGRKSSNILTNLTSFNKIFIKNVSYDNIKSKGKQGPTIYLEHTFLEKPQGRGGSQNAPGLSHPPNQLFIVMRFSGVNTF